MPKKKKKGVYTILHKAILWATQMPPTYGPGGQEVKAPVLEKLGPWGWIWRN